MRTSLTFTLIALCTASTSARAAEPVRLASPSERFDADTDEIASFRRHVVPLLGRAGCSGRACHGSFKGQGGFRLSLFGYDFGADHNALMGETPATKGAPAEEGDPRVDLADPAESLMLLKPTMKKKHRGKKRIDEGSWQYHLLHSWVASGAKDDSKEIGNLARLEVTPSEVIFSKPGATVALQVIAHWTDGSSEDVTELTRFRTNDDAVALVDETGVARSVAAGDTHIVAFYDNGVTPVPILLPVSDRSGERYPEVATSTKVDELIAQKLRKMGIVPSEITTDTEFLRRVSVELTGTLPTPAEVTSFASDERSDKRTRKIDELLASPQYAAWWTTKLCDITGNSPRQSGEKFARDSAARQWYDWIFRRVEQNVPYDEIIQGIVMAGGRREGQSYEDFATEMSSYLRESDPADFAARETMPHYWARKNLRKPEEKALNFSYAFLGVRLQCAQCHKHPFDQWSQEDFRHFQAFFDPIRYSNSQDAKAMMTSLESTLGIGDDPKDKQKKKKQLYKLIEEKIRKGEPAPWNELRIQLPKQPKPRKPARNKKPKAKKKRYTGRVVTPKLLGGDEITAKHEDPRNPLMGWLSDPANPYFARAFVNRVWANYFGRGIVEPADDMNLANPPSNAALLDYLARGFVESGFDMKWLHREVLTSDSYQRSWRPNETNRLDERNFSRRTLRRLPAEVTWDGVVQATVGSRSLASLRTDLPRRAIGPNVGLKVKGRNNRGLTYALGIFGKPARETTCDCERSSDPTLLQTIFTRNDGEMWGLIDARDGWIAELNAIENPRLSSRERRQREKQRRSKKGNNQPAGGKSERPERPKLPDTDKLIAEVYLRTVNRVPSDRELERARGDVSKAKSVTAGIRDLLWVMLNTKEFIVNH